MKKLFLILFILATCVSISGAGNIDKLTGVIARKNTAPVTACNGNFTPGDPHDLFCEDFEDAGSPIGDASWTETVNGTNTISYPAHGAGLGCTGKGSYAIQINYDGNNTNSETAAIYTAVTESEVNVTLEFSLIAESGTFDGPSLDELNFFSIMGASSKRLVKIYAAWDGSAWDIKYVANHTGGNETETLINDIQFGASTWYTLQIHWVRNTSGGVTVSVDGAASVDIAGTTPDEDSVEVSLGSRDDAHSAYYHDNETATIQLDIVFADNDTIPLKCTE